MGEQNCKAFVLKEEGGKRRKTRKKQTIAIQKDFCIFKKMDKMKANVKHQKGKQALNPFSAKPFE